MSETLHPQSQNTRKGFEATYRPRITFFIEFDTSSYRLVDKWPWWKPGYFRGPFKDGYFKRVWWLCFAIGWVKISLHEYNRWIEQGRTSWNYPEETLWCAYCGKWGKHQSGWCDELKRGLKSNQVTKALCGITLTLILNGCGTGGDHNAPVPTPTPTISPLRPKPKPTATPRPRPKPTPTPTPRPTATPTVTPVRTPTPTPTVTPTPVTPTATPSATPTPFFTPTPPPSPTVTPTSVPGQAEAVWSDTGADYYVLFYGERSRTALGFTSYDNAIKVTGTKVLINGLTVGKTYFFAVKGVHSGVETDYSNELSYTR